MPILSVEIPDRLETFVETGVRSGRFSSAGDAVVEGLRDLEEREREYQAKVDWLNEAVLAGVKAIESGRFIRLRTDEEIDACIDRLWNSVPDNPGDDKAPLA